MQCSHYCLLDVVAFDSNLELILLGQIFIKHLFVVATVVQYNDQMVTVKISIQRKLQNAFYGPLQQ